MFKRGNPFRRALVGGTAPNPPVENTPPVQQATPLASEQIPGITNLSPTDSNGAPTEIEIIGGNNHTLSKLQKAVAQKQQEIFALDRKSPAEIVTNIKQFTAINSLHLEFTSLGANIYHWQITRIESNGASYVLLNQKVRLEPGIKFKLGPKLINSDIVFFDFETENGALVLKRLRMPGNLQIKSNMPLIIQDVKIDGHVYVDTNKTVEFTTACEFKSLVINGDIKLNPDAKIDTLEDTAFITSLDCDLKSGSVSCEQKLTIYAPQALSYDLDKLKACTVDITANSLAQLQLKDNYPCHLIFEALNAHPEPYSLIKKINIPNALYLLAKQDNLIVGSLDAESELLGSNKIFFKLKGCALAQVAITATDFGIQADFIHAGLAVQDQLDENGYFNHRRFSLTVNDNLILNALEPILLNRARVKIIQGDAFVAASMLDFDSSEMIINSNNPDNIPTNSILAVNSVRLNLHQASVGANHNKWQDRSTPRYVELWVRDAIKNRSIPSAIYAYGNVVLPANAPIHNYGGKLVGSFSTPNLTSTEIVESRILAQTLFGSTQYKRNHWDNWYIPIEDRVDVTCRHKPILGSYDDTTLALGMPENEAKLEGLVFGANANLSKVQFGPKAARYNMNLGIADKELEFEVDNIYRVASGNYIYEAKVPFLRQFAKPIDRIVLIDGQVTKFAEHDLPFPLFLTVELEIERIVPMFAKYNTLELFGADLNPTEVRRKLLQNTIKLLEELSAKGIPITLEEIAKIETPILYYVPKQKTLNDGSTRTVLCPAPLAPKKYLQLSEMPDLAQLRDINATAKLTVTGGLLAWNINMQNGSLHTKRLVHEETQTYRNTTVIKKGVTYTDVVKTARTPQIHSGIIQAQSLQGTCQDFVIDGGSVKLEGDSNLTVSGDLKLNIAHGVAILKSESFGYVGRRNAHATEFLAKNFVIEASIECAGKFILKKVNGDAFDANSKLINVELKTPDGQLIKVTVDFKDEMPTVYCQFKTGNSNFKTFLAIAVGVAIGIAAPELLPAWNSFVVAMGAGAMASAASTAIQGGDVLKSALEGAVFAGFGAFVSSALAEVKVLSEAAKDTIRVGATSVVSSAVNGGNIAKDGLVSVATNIVATSILPPTTATTKAQAVKETQKAIARNLITATTAGVVQGQELGNALMSSGIGAAATITGTLAGNQVNSAVVAAKQKTKVKAKPAVPPKKCQLVKLMGAVIGFTNL